MTKKSPDTTKWVSAYKAPAGIDRPISFKSRKTGEMVVIPLREDIGGIRELLIVDQRWIDRFRDQLRANPIDADDAERILANSSSAHDLVDSLFWWARGQRTDVPRLDFQVVERRATMEAHLERLDEIARSILPEVHRLGAGFDPFEDLLTDYLSTIKIATDKAEQLHKLFGGKTKEEKKKGGRPQTGGGHGDILDQLWKIGLKERTCWKIMRAAMMASGMAGHAYTWYLGIAKKYRKS